MKCEEMMNLMQQSLDQDLTAEEELDMLAHLKQCPGCSDLYVRLKLLHEELAQLPKVKPAYSIVDAILPQLEEIPLWNADSAEGPETSAAAKENIIAMPPAANRTNRRGLISWKIFSGVAVAGIIIGLILSNPNSLHLNKSASESTAMDTRMGAPQAESALGASTADKSKQDSLLAGSTNQGLAVAPTSKGSAEASSSAAPSTPAAAPEGSAEQKDTSGRVTMASPMDYSVSVTDQFGALQKQQSVPEGQGQGQEAVPGSSDVTPEQQFQNAEAADSMPESLSGETPEAGYLPLAPVEMAAADGPASAEPQQGGGVSSMEDKDIRYMGFTALTGAAALEPVTSPDGLYTASVTDGRMSISDKEGKAVFMSSILLGPELQVKLGEWTDAHTFSYTVRTVSGTETVYVISASLGKEWKK